MEDLILEMREITKAFPGVLALDRASLKVKKGSVHALMGENGAGKSTLMKCLFGIYSKDSGDIVFDGKPVDYKDSKEALDGGIAMIHQELQPIPKMTVAENVFLGDYPKKGIFVDHARMNEKTKEYLNIVGLNVDPRTLLGDLTISQQQSVEIAKAISKKAKIVIMDEPTSSLTETEVKKLFEIIRLLCSQNIAVIYISHKMDEILEISDEITILRDGQYVGTYDSKHITTDEIIHHMVGRTLTNQYPDHVDESSEEIIFEVKHLTSPRKQSFYDCSFKLRKGEILGVAGLVGAQRSELMEAIFGLRSYLDTGEIYIHGKKEKIQKPEDAIKKGLALVTEDRRDTGIFGVLSVFDNITIASLKNHLGSLGLLSEKALQGLVNKGITDLRIKTPSSSTKISSLSGGNQQKVILSRWLSTNPEIFIMDEPTRGIDVGAKYEIYEIMDNLSKEGKSVIMISSEMGELLGMADRIMVMCEGKISGFLDIKEANQEKIMELATKFMRKDMI